MLTATLLLLHQAATAQAPCPITVEAPLFMSLIHTLQASHHQPLTYEGPSLLGQVSVTHPKDLASTEALARQLVDICTSCSLSTSGTRIHLHEPGSPAAQAMEHRIQIQAGPTRLADVVAQIQGALQQTYPDRIVRFVLTAHPSTQAEVPAFPGPVSVRELLSSLEIVRPSRRGHPSSERVVWMVHDHEERLNGSVHVVDPGIINPQTSSAEDVLRRLNNVIVMNEISIWRSSGEVVRPPPPGLSRAELEAMNASLLEDTRRSLARHTQEREALLARCPVLADSPVNRLPEWLEEPEWREVREALEARGVLGGR